jgi:hypothetical protein
LTDSLFKEGFGTHLVSSPYILKKMTEADNPFDGIDLILVTHTDEGHFEPQLAADFLKKIQFQRDLN